MSRALVFGGLAVVALAAAGGAYVFLNKGGDPDVDASEHVPAADGTAAGETVKDTLGTDDGGGISDDASEAVDAIEEGAEPAEGESLPEGATNDVYGDTDGAAMHDEDPHADTPSESESAGAPN